MKPYNYRNCLSLFGYAAQVHLRSGGQCQLCLCGDGTLDFDFWRQMTVEHIIGKSQGGYLKQIREAVASRFPGLSVQEQEDITRRLDEANTISACSFCNSTTSRSVCERPMATILEEAAGSVEDVIAHTREELHRILDRKRQDVQWKLRSVRSAFEREVQAKLQERHRMPSAAE